MLKYLDAGTGSMLVQMAVAGVAGAAVFFKVYWAKVTEPFRRNRPTTRSSPSRDHAHQARSLSPLTTDGWERSRRPASTRHRSATRTAPSCMPAARS